MTYAPSLPAVQTTVAFRRGGQQRQVVVSPWIRFAQKSCDAGEFVLVDDEEVDVVEQPVDGTRAQARR